MPGTRSETLANELEIVQASYPECEIERDDETFLVRIKKLPIPLDKFCDAQEKLFNDPNYTILKAKDWSPEYELYSMDVQILVPVDYPKCPIPMVVVESIWDDHDDWQDLLETLDMEFQRIGSDDQCNESQIWMGLELVMSSIPVSSVYAHMIFDAEAALSGCKADNRESLRSRDLLLRNPINDVKVNVKLNTPKTHDPGTVTKSLFGGLEIHHGTYDGEKKSTFQSHFCIVKNMDDIIDVLETLYSIPSIGRAAHNIVAYKLRDADGGDYDGHESDGESAAGHRLTHLFNDAGVIPDTLVVVTRWWGGILMGPSRFRYIKRSAQILLEEHGRIQRKNKHK